MVELLRAVIARIIGGWIASLCIWLAAKYDIIIPEDQMNDAIAATVAWCFAIFSFVYPIVHKQWNRKLNPGDAASHTMIIAEKMERERRM